MAAPNPRALIVDDEPDLCELLSLTLARMNVESNAVHDLAAARQIGRASCRERV